MSHRPLYTNRLIQEKSPYLQQHAHDPIDWYPWSEEAFRQAESLHRPIFLSIGYASCHWCHVMQRESFQNLDLAQNMNDTFVNVLVDREEMPHVDALYMELAQAMLSGRAGWPLNIVMTPNGAPFFATTYLPPDVSQGMLGFRQLIQRVQDLWGNPEEKEVVEIQADRIVNLFRDIPEMELASIPSSSLLQEAEIAFFKVADPVYGGMQGVPKFPIGFQATFLLHRCRAHADSRSLFYVQRSLDMMHRGGVYDHLGGGFARYSIDEHWLIPHFEKMVADNAILALLYIEAWQYTKNADYGAVAQEIIHYLEHSMKGDHGAFYSSEDADIDGKEGEFYTWSWDELHQILQGDASLFCQFYGVSPSGNFKGRNILHQVQSMEDFAALRRINPEDLKNSLDSMRWEVLKARSQRPPPIQDDKIIVAYNALVIRAFVEAGWAFAEPRYFAVAKEVAQFLKQNMWQPGMLCRRWRDGESRFDAGLDDYALLIHGLFALFQADQGQEWLDWALALLDEVEHHFSDEEGLYFTTNGMDTHLCLRRVEFYDTTEPAGIAVMADNFLFLATLFADATYRTKAETIFRAGQEHLIAYPPGMGYYLVALEKYYDATAPILVIVLDEQETWRSDLMHVLGSLYIPHKMVIWLRANQELPFSSSLLEGKIAQSGKTTLYLCYLDRCCYPINDWDQMVETLSKL